MLTLVSVTEIIMPHQNDYKHRPKGSNAYGAPIKGDYAPELRA